MNEKTQLRIALSLLEFLSLEEKLLLEKKLGGFEELSSLSLSQLELKVGRVLKTKVFPFLNLAAIVNRDIAIMKKLGIGALHYSDEDFPVLLKQIYDCPYMIFYRGDKSLLNQLSIAMVGSRHCSSSGVLMAKNFSSELCERGFVVVSGLANGIDSASHIGTLASGKTIAVLACGVDEIYPKNNVKLACSILEKGGLIISEHPPMEAPLKYRFPQRNRIISGLSQGVIVMESPPKSGSLITADFAIEQNRELFFHKNALEMDLKLGDEYLKNKSVSLARAMKIKRVSSYVEDGAKVVDSVDELLKALFN
ncbi:MAG: DNA-processing protein DprA [Treponemataceae bacterium]|nr:DNA-processing protein DprA [Spirochaetales bacterium]MDY6030322.1 DNA-processing protein DprA [Treponemataceae bacterium]